MKNLLEEQLQKESDYYKIGKDFQKTKLRGNIKAGKRKLFHELDELDEIEELPSIFTTIPTDRSKKIRATQKVFNKVIKQVPSTDRKKIKINYDETNNLTIQEERNDWRKQIKNWRKNLRIQNLFKTMQNELKSVFYSVANLSKTIIKRLKNVNFCKFVWKTWRQKFS